MGQIRDLSVSAVIVHHGPVDELRGCLSAIRDAYPRLDVVVVDNASPEPAPADLASSFGVTIVRSDRNLGFSGGVNTGIASFVEGPSWVLILNPDVRLQSGVLERLLETGESDPTIGIVAPALVGAAGEVQSSARSAPTGAKVLAHRTPLGRTRRGRRRLGEYLWPCGSDLASHVDVDWVIGACILARYNAGSETEWLDDRFFLYFEDVDWCIRLRDAGWRIVYEPAVTVFHAHRRASRGVLPFRKAQRLHLQSAIRFYARHPRVLLSV